MRSRGCRSTRCTGPPRSTPGSWSGSPPIVAVEAEIPRPRPADRPRRMESGSSATASPTPGSPGWRASRRRRSPRRAVPRALRPVYKRIDTCAAEFASRTPYMYSAYEDLLGIGDGAGGPECESDPTDRDKIVILGGGPNRIGQGIEFDYCCVHAAYALKEAGFETIMVNCNPETVSTDYDTSDRLYFEPLTAEDVLELIHVESGRGRVLGVIVQFGGQTPLKLARDLEAAGRADPGHAAGRHRPGRGQGTVRRPPPTAWTSSSRPTASPAPPTRPKPVAARIGYPVLLRPSYVLGGRAMETVHDVESLRRYIAHAVKVSGRNPGADRSLPEGRDRGRRGRRVRRRPGLRRRDHGAYSRRPGSTPVTAPAPCRRIRSAAPSWPRSSGRPACWPGRWAWSG